MGYTFTDKDRQKSKETRDKNFLEDFIAHPDTLRTTDVLRRALELSAREMKCECCGQDTNWNGQFLVLEIDHIDGNHENNRLDNLRFLCPNCHSQTETFRGRNINTGKIKVTDDELITALKESANIRQALIKVGLTPKGGNYVRAKKLKEQIS